MDQREVLCLLASLLDRCTEEMRVSDDVGQTKYVKIINVDWLRNEIGNRIPDGEGT